MKSQMKITTAECCLGNESISLLFCCNHLIYLYISLLESLVDVVLWSFIWKEVYYWVGALTSKNENENAPHVM